MILKLTCEKCKGAIFSYRDTDCYGNNVLSTRCWNGHIIMIEIEGIKTSMKTRLIEKTGSKNDLISYIGLYY